MSWLGGIRITCADILDTNFSIRLAYFYSFFNRGDWLKKQFTI